MSAESKFVIIPTRDCAQLLIILSTRLPKAAQFYNLVKISLSGAFDEETTFFRYSGLDDNVTCFVSKLVGPEKIYWYILAPICPEKESRKVISALTPIINWHVNCSFLVLDDVLLQSFVDYCPKPQRIQSFGPGDVYYMPRNVAMGMDTSVPPGATVRKLTESDMETVLTHWKWAHQWGVDFIIKAALHLDSAGLFLNGHLVSWAIYIRDGGIHALFTLNEHRGKGYGKTLMKCICKSVASKEHFPVVQIERGNSASAALMTQIGFQFSHSFEWTEYDGLP